MKTIRAEELFRVGFISRLHGYKGEMLCAADNPDTTLLSSGKFLFVLFDGLPVPFEITSIRNASGDLLIKLAGVENETLARRFVQKEIFMDAIDEEEESEFSYRDLKGFTAIDNKAGSLGKIESVDEYPMQWIARCRVNNNEVLIPLNENTIVKILKRKKEIRLDLPDGLLDVYLSA